ncbi:hypothetical protein [Xanthomonas phage XAJ2]|uniref:Uncharacterized protein n=1 Tax=Xanthomonas phage XAJ2 TaxID=1775249 RepID=A0A1I9L2I7_9CAUD|nr:hypothetical protein [Xanthomonas phage XAJ2]
MKWLLVGGPLNNERRELTVVQGKVSIGYKENPQLWVNDGVHVYEVGYRPNNDALYYSHSEPRS